MEVEGANGELKASVEQATATMAREYCPFDHGVVGMAVVKLRSLRLCLRDLHLATALPTTYTMAIPTRQST